MSNQAQNKTLDPSEIKRRMVRYYSQNGEDCFLRALLGHPETGLFIDVGAFDGKYLSNSYSFAENGWNVICVEPLKQYAEMCAANQPKSVCVNAACVASDDIKSVSFASEPLGIYSRLEVKDGDLAHLQDFYEKRGDHLENFKMIEVPAVTVWGLAQQHFPGAVVDVLSVDVEGSELSVLAGARLSELKPRVICAEANSDEERLALDQYLAGFHYTYLRTMGVNHFYSAEPTLIELARTIVVRCSIERQSHPMGARYTIPGILSGHFVDEAVQRTAQELRSSLQQEKRRIQQVLAMFQRIGNAPTATAENFEQALKAVERSVVSLRNSQQQLKQRVGTLEQSLRESRQALHATEYALRASQQSARLDMIEHNDFRASHWHIRIPSWLRKPTAPAQSGLEAALRLLDEKIQAPQQRPLPDKTKVCITGFSRPANIALVSELRRRRPALNAPNIIALHARNALLVDVGLRLGVPTYVVICPPLEGISSYHADSGLPLRTCIRQWIEFHRHVLSVVDMIWLVRADDVRLQPDVFADMFLRHANLGLPKEPDAESRATAAASVPNMDLKIDAAELAKAAAIYEKLLSSNRILAADIPT